MKYLYYYPTPIGTLRIVEEENAITGLYYEGRYEAKEDAPTELLHRAGCQLSEYFRKTRREFDLPLRFQGTEFQIKVWNALRNIPYGTTRSYGEIAGQVGNPKASRAVGGANNRNPIMILVPCHRVIGANGDLTGFGAGIGVKRYLLDLEQKD